MKIAVVAALLCGNFHANPFGPELQVKRNVRWTLRAEEIFYGVKMIIVKEEEKVLTKDSGLYEFDFNVKCGSNYFVIDTNDFTGNVDILIN